MTLNFASWSAGKVAPGTFELQIASPKPGPKPEAVSKRLKAELIHPNRQGSLYGLRFSPDGSKLIAGDYPGGVVQVWDVASGKQLTKFETGYGYRGSIDYFHVTPDWRTLIVAREGRRETEAVEVDGKRLRRWQFSGDIRAWDLATGNLMWTLQHEPPREIRNAVLSPDGNRLLTCELLPGEYEGHPAPTVTIWDLKTGKPRTASVDRPEAYLSFSPTGREWVVTTFDSVSESTNSVTMLDLQSDAVRWSVPVAAAAARHWNSLRGFSPDGRLLIVTAQVFKDSNKWDQWTHSLQIWEAATGKELASLPPLDSDHYSTAQFSPDSRTIVTSNYRKKVQRVFFWQPLTGADSLKEIVLAEASDGFSHRPIQPAFSPDGKWVAMAAQLIPESRGGNIDPLDFQQPRIHLIDVATREIKETIIAPHGSCGSLCFSPDGKTLASAGLGRVLLWDISDVAAK